MFKKETTVGIIDFCKMHYSIIHHVGTFMYWRECPQNSKRFLSTTITMKLLLITKYNNDVQLIMSSQFHASFR